MKAALGPYSNLVNFYQSRLAMIFFFGGVQRILCLRCVPSLSHSLGVTPIHSCPERLCKNKMHHCVHSILCSVLYCIVLKTSIFLFVVITVAQSVIGTKYSENERFTFGFLLKISNFRVDFVDRRDTPDVLLAWNGARP